MMNSSICLWILLSIGASLVSVCWTEELTPIVNLRDGKVRGLTKVVEGGGKVHFYQGIRYGEAARFSKPKPTAPWTEVYEATAPRAQCPQIPIMPNGGMYQANSSSEDCLFLNIWAPAAESNSSRSVMVFIHGGSFTGGTIFTSAIDGGYYAERGDVILVAIAYRLGPLGFLVGGDVPGNLGLHDQIFALKWIQQNIHHFGGNPASVTVFGESSGSMNVGHLILSPLAKGLFKRAIMQSGAPNSNYIATISKAVALDKTKSFASALHCPLSPLNKTIDCIRKKSLKEIEDGTKQMVSKIDFFLPVYGDEVVPIAPQEALNTGKLNQNVDLMYGVNRDEGSHYVSLFVPQIANDSNLITLEFTKQSIMKAMKFHNQSHVEEIADFYTQNLNHNSTQDELKISIAQSIGDLRLTCPTILFGEQMSKFSLQHNATIYSYRLMQHVHLPKVGYSPWKGVTHGEDTAYLFMAPFLTHKDDKQLSSDMIRAWSTFAKTGHPGMVGGSVQWGEAIDRKLSNEPITSYMSLSVTDYKMVNRYFSRTCNAFWKSRLLQ